MGYVRRNLFDLPAKHTWIVFRYAVRGYRCLSYSGIGEPLSVFVTGNEGGTTTCADD